VSAAEELIDQRGALLPQLGGLKIQKAFLEGGQVFPGFLAEDLIELFQRFLLHLRSS